MGMTNRDLYLGILTALARRAVAEALADYRQENRTAVKA
jgi:hypothetical protein